MRVSAEPGPSSPTRHPPLPALEVPTYVGPAPDLAPHRAVGACSGPCLLLIGAHCVCRAWSSAPAWLCSALRPRQAPQSTHGAVPPQLRLYLCSLLLHSVGFLPGSPRIPPPPPKPFTCLFAC